MGGGRSGTSLCGFPSCQGGSQVWWLHPLAQPSPPQRAGHCGQAFLETVWALGFGAQRPGERGRQALVWSTDHPCQISPHCQSLLPHARGTFPHTDPKKSLPKAQPAQGGLLGFSRNRTSRRSPGRAGPWDQEPFQGIFWIKQQNHVLSESHLIPLARTMSLERVPSRASAAGHSWDRVNIWIILIHVVRAKLLLISLDLC